MKDIIKKSFDFDNLQGQGVFVDLQNGFTTTKEHIPSMVRTWHKIEKNEPVYIIFYATILKKGDFFSADRTYHCSTCIREEGISFYCSVETSGWLADESDNVSFAMAWKEIESVDRYTMNGENNPNALIIKNDPIIKIHSKVIRFYSKENHTFMAVPLGYFANIPSSGQQVTALIQGINNLINNLGQSNQEYEELLKRLGKLNENNQYDEFLKVIEEYDLWNTDDFYINGGIIEALIEVGREDDAEEVFAVMEKDYEELKKQNKEEDIENISYLYQISKGLINKYKKDDYQAAASLQLAKNLGKKLDNLDRAGEQEFNKEIQTAYGQYIEKFETLPYAERKVITMTNTENLFQSENLTLLQMNMLPNNVKFPITHPKKDHTYICHPWDNNVYLPIEDYDLELLNDRVNEYCYLMQCLGATHISIKNRKNEGLYEKRDTTNNYKANGSYLGRGGNGTYDEDIKKEEDKQSRFAFAKEQSFNPTKKPFIPQNLIWFPHEVSWQRLAQQRLDGAILQHSEMVASSQNKVLSHSEMRDINADLDLLIVQIGGGRKTSEDYQIKMNEDVEWEISVSFKPIEDFGKENTVSHFSDIAQTIEVEEISNPNAFTDEELQYMEDIKHMLEDDDVIDEKEGALLERFRTMRNISEQRAEELKNIVLTSWKNDLTDAEKEYLKDYEAFIQDGEIQERERKMLNRLAGLLGISEERVLEIEKNCRI